MGQLLLQRHLHILAPQVLLPLPLLLLLPVQMQRLLWCASLRCGRSCCHLIAYPRCTLLALLLLCWWLLFWQGRQVQAGTHVEASLELFPQQLVHARWHPQRLDPRRGSGIHWYAIPSGSRQYGCPEDLGEPAFSHRWHYLQCRIQHFSH